jgi:hypothetical protein
MIVAFNPNHEPIGQVIAVARDAQDGDLGTVAVLTASGEALEVLGHHLGVYAVPDGLTYEEWASNHIRYRMMSAAQMPPSHPADYWRSLGMSGLPLMRVWAAARMVDYVGQSSFWTSLREQIVTWLATPAGQRRFRDPLSPNQWRAVLKDPVTTAKGKALIDDISAGKDLRPLPDVTL